MFKQFDYRDAAPTTTGTHPTTAPSRALTGSQFVPPTVVPTASAVLTGVPSHSVGHAAQGHPGVENLGIFDSNGPGYMTSGQPGSIRPAVARPQASVVTDEIPPAIEMPSYAGSPGARVRNFMHSAAYEPAIIEYEAAIDSIENFCQLHDLPPEAAAHLRALRTRIQAGHYEDATLLRFYGTTRCEIVWLAEFLKRLGNTPDIEVQDIVTNLATDLAPSVCVPGQLDQVSSACSKLKATRAGGFAKEFEDARHSLIEATSAASGGHDVHAEHRHRTKAAKLLNEESPGYDQYARGLKLSPGFKARLMSSITPVKLAQRMADNALETLHKLIKKYGMPVPLSYDDYSRFDPQNAGELIPGTPLDDLAARFGRTNLDLYAMFRFDPDGNVAYVPATPSLLVFKFLEGAERSGLVQGFVPATVKLSATEVIRIAGKAICVSVPGGIRRLDCNDLHALPAKALTDQVRRQLRLEALLNSDDAQRDNFPASWVLSAQDLQDLLPFLSKSAQRRLIDQRLEPCLKTTTADGAQSLQIVAALVKARYPVPNWCWEMTVDRDGELTPAGHDLLNTFIRLGNKEAVEIILSHVEQVGKESSAADSPVGTAVRCCQPDMVKRLRDKSLNLSCEEKDSVQEDGTVPGFWTLMHKLEGLSPEDSRRRIDALEATGQLKPTHPYLLDSAIGNGDVESLEYLRTKAASLGKKKDVVAKCADTGSMAHAIQSGKLAMVHYLASREVSVEGFVKRTSLLALAINKGDREMVELLIALGARVDSQARKAARDRHDIQTFLDRLGLSGGTLPAEERAAVLARYKRPG